jgi:phospholipase/carboxylesterase
MSDIENNDGATLKRPHVFEAGTEVATSRTILLLHGMGADEHDLLGLGRLLDSNANLLSPRGMVKIEGLNRFFLRFADGSFDEGGLAHAADELAEFLKAAAQEYGFDLNRVWAAGFSNGSNAAVALLQRHPELLQGISVYSITKALAEPIGEPGLLAGKQVFIANGEHDQHAGLAVPRLLAAQLKQLGANVDLMEHQGGHNIVMEHVRPVMQYLAGN